MILMIVCCSNDAFGLCRVFWDLDYNGHVDGIEIGWRYFSHTFCYFSHECYFSHVLYSTLMLVYFGLNIIHNPFSTIIIPTRPLLSHNYCHITMDTIEDTIPAPPNDVYTSYKDAYDALTQHSLENGYGFHQKDSRPYSSDFKTWFYYRCDKAGKYKSQATIRKTRT
jgi:hypothetical protein